MQGCLRLSSLGLHIPLENFSHNVNYLNSRDEWPKFPRRSLREGGNAFPLMDVFHRLAASSIELLLLLAGSGYPCATLQLQYWAHGPVFSLEALWLGKHSGALDYRKAARESGEKRHI
jgi:hypothetical protein